jgi:hypothetical protein
MYARENLSRHPILMFVRELFWRHPLLVITIVASSLLLNLWWPGSAAFSIWRRAASGQPKQAANLAGPAGLAGDMQALEQFDLRVEEGLYPNERQALAAELQSALGYVADRIGHRPSSRFTAVLVREENCRLHGLAYTDDLRTVQIFSCNDIPRARAVALMSHEFVHQIQQDYYGPAHLSSDIILSEGMATFAAGKYWLDGKPDFRS